MVSCANQPNRNYTQWAKACWPTSLLFRVHSLRSMCVLVIWYVRMLLFIIACLLVKFVLTKIYSGYVFICAFYQMLLHRFAYYTIWLTWEIVIGHCCAFISLSLSLLHTYTNVNLSFSHALQLNGNSHNILQNHLKYFVFWLGNVCLNCVYAELGKPLADVFQPGWKINANKKEATVCCALQTTMQQT